MCYSKLTLSIYLSLSISLYISPQFPYLGVIVSYLSNPIYLFISIYFSTYLSPIPISWCYTYSKLSLTLYISLLHISPPPHICVIVSQTVRLIYLHICTNGENYIGAPNMRNNFGGIYPIVKTSNITIAIL